MYPEDRMTNEQASRTRPMYTDQQERMGRALHILLQLMKNICLREGILPSAHRLDYFDFDIGRDGRVYNLNYGNDDGEHTIPTNNRLLDRCGAEIVRVRLMAN